MNRDPLQRLLNSGWKPVNLPLAYPKNLPCPGCGMLLKRGRLQNHARYVCTNPNCRVYDVRLKRLKRRGLITLMKFTYAEIPQNGD